MISPRQVVFNQQGSFTKPNQKLLDKTLKQSSERRESSLIFNQLYEQSIQNCGLIRAEWIGQKKLQSICYGSGVAISKRVVLTCAHSIFHDEKSLLCDVARFVPGHKEGKLQIQEKVYSSYSPSSIKLKPLRQGEKFGKLPISEDLALIYLSQDLQLDSFPQVGVQEVGEIPEKSSIMICGYPSLGYFRCPNMQDIDFKRTALHGQLSSIIGSTIFHCLDTKTGHSGSPIFGTSRKTGYPTIIGVHTHKGKTKNSGVFLNNSNLKRLARYEIQLGLAHHQYQMGIKFPQAIKRQAWIDLSLKQKRQFKNRKQYYQKMAGCQDNSEQSGSQDEQNFSEGSDMQDFYKQDMNVGPPDFSKLLDKNMRLMQKILKDLPYNIFKKALCSWLLIESDALSIFRQLTNKSSQKKAKTNKICKETNNIIAYLQRQLQQSYKIFGRSNQIQIFRCKFPSVEQQRSKYRMVS